MESLSSIGIQTIEAAISASGNSLIIISCTARAPWSRHNGQVGESKARNRIFFLWLLNRNFNAFSEPSSVTIFFDRLLSIRPRVLSIGYLWTKSGKWTPPFQIVHHLADIRQASFAFGVFGGALTWSHLLCGPYLFHNHRAAVLYEILPDVFAGIFKTITN